jgi:catechol 2,3-dioxygenase-like lactoylglutathione lyase family enzyme
VEVHRGTAVVECGRLALSVIKELAMLGSNNIVAFVPITDGAKAREFYEGKLGLGFLKDDDFAIVFESNGIRLRAVKMKEVKPAHFTVLGWEVKAIEQVVTSLRERGVHFETFGFFKQDELGIWTAPSGDKVAWFKDPDGNILSVSEHV